MDVNVAPQNLARDGGESRIAAQSRQRTVIEVNREQGPQGGAFGFEDGLGALTQGFVVAHAPQFLAAGAKSFRGQEGGPVKKAGLRKAPQGPRGERSCR